MANSYLNIPLGNGQEIDPPESPDDSPTNLNQLQNQIACTQARIDALGHIIETAMSQMAGAMRELDRLKERAEFGAFFEFVAGLDFDRPAEAYQ